MSKYPPQVQESKIRCKLVNIVYECSIEVIIVFMVPLMFVMYIELDLVEDEATHHNL